MFNWARSSGPIPRDSELVSRNEHSSSRVLVYITSLGYVAVSVKVLVIHISSVLCVVRKWWWITVTLLGEGMATPVSLLLPRLVEEYLSFFPMFWGLRVMSSLCGSDD